MRRQGSNNAANLIRLQRYVSRVRLITVKWRCRFLGGGAIILIGSMIFHSLNQIRQYFIILIGSMIFHSLNQIS